MDKQSNGTLPGGAYWRWDAEAKTLTMVLPHDVKTILITEDGRPIA